MDLNEHKKRTPIILASRSPRRAELLERLGVRFSVEPSDVIERPLANEAPGDYTMRTARAKAVEIARPKHEGLIIGADTVVVMDGSILGKPADEQDARRTLAELSGRWHAVMTGLALYDARTKREAADYAKTLVKFAELSRSEIDWYVSTGEPMDKAGSYGIQGMGGIFVDEISGNYHNVVGLPLSLLHRLVRQLGSSLI